MGKRFNSLFKSSNQGSQIERGRKKETGESQRGGRNDGIKKEDLGQYNA